MESLPFKLIYHVALVISVVALLALRRADHFGFGGAEWVHRAVAAFFGIALAVAALSFGMHLYAKHGARLAAVISPLFVAAAGWAYSFSFAQRSAGESEPECF